MECCLQEETSIKYFVCLGYIWLYRDSIEKAFLWPDQAQLKAAVTEFLPCADILKLSDEELFFITGKEHIADAVEELFAMGILLARALYKDAPLLLLDEPTSALDPLAETAIYEQYHRLSEGKTTIFISHRLASTKFCDRIIYYENGQVKEDGTHDELMKKNGAYAKMFEIQSQYYNEKGGDFDE